MKHLFLTITAAAALLTLSACSKSDYEDKYIDPSKTSNVSCDKLMTGVFFTGKTFTFTEYWRVFTFDFRLLGVCAQTVGFVNSANRYSGSGETYINDRWNHFYYTLAQYRLLENTYGKLTDGEKADYEIFVLLSQIFLYEQLQEIVDLFGDVPFSEAGYLALTGDVKTARPSYDKAETLYEMMLDDLKAINTKLASYSPSPLAAAYLPAQDYINRGDLAKWRKFANSLRLRMAIRVADNGSLTTKARAILAEMLADPNTYPVIEANSDNIRIEADNSTDDFKVVGTSDVGIQGIESWAGQVNRASKAMLDALGADDPRLEVMYDPNSNGDYVGMATDENETDQSNNMIRPAAQGGILYAAIDTSTFSRNAEFPGFMMTAAEVWFIKAEAFQKSYATGNAAEAFKEGVTKSVDLYYGLNATGTYRTPVTPPTNTAEFAQGRWDNATDKLVAIGTQKWLHCGLIDMPEAWAQVRRTGIPALTFPTDNLSSAYPNVFERLRYPLDERTNNAEVYAKVQATDTYYRKLFWAKP
ncbi:MAG: SusD/RagB family nutrient-binding outer membrane lipoprotein [Prevotellaceae bacterium]|jgi:hypothetical protein|nr:SusD/RagB family nutrient-binding outer membrane lipoprotein [Prevotellaceae bacterium]